MSEQKYIQKGFDKTLAHFIEECGECLAAAGKTQRWGLESVNPELSPEQQETNKDWLIREIKDLKSVINRLEQELGLTPSVNDLVDDLKTILNHAKGVKYEWRDEIFPAAQRIEAFVRAQLAAQEDENG